MKAKAAERPLAIGILGHIGNENLGDEAIFTSVIENVRARFPDSAIYGFTIRPEDTEARHRIPAFPIRRRPRRSAPAAAPSPPTVSGQPAKRRLEWLRPLLRPVRRGVEYVPLALREAGFLVRSYRAMPPLDLLIVAGSQQLNDYVGGAWAFPYTLLKWAAMARARGGSVAVVSVGAGPINTRLGKRFIRAVLWLAAYRSYRDERSVKLIEGEMQVPGRHVLAPDLVFGLRAPRLPAPKHGSRPPVAINPLPLFHGGYWHEGDESVYRGYVLTLARFAEWLVARGYDVSFFPTQLRVDPGVIRDVLEAMQAEAREHAAEMRVTSMEELWTGLAAARFVVATRYHGILFALLAGKPVLALAYHGKSRDLMSMAGQGRFALDADACSLESLCERFVALEAERNAVEADIAGSVPALRAEVDAQFDALCALARGPVAGLPGKALETRPDFLETPAAQKGRW